MWVQGAHRTHGNCRWNITTSIKRIWVVYILGRWNSHNLIESWLRHISVPVTKRYLRFIEFMIMETEIICCEHNIFFINKDGRSECTLVLVRLYQPTSPFKMPPISTIRSFYKLSITNRVQLLVILICSSRWVLPYCTADGSTIGHSKWWT